jgi:hypothetical protein
MYNVNGDGKIVDEYLSRCKRAYDNGCYHELMRDQELLRTNTLNFLSRDEKGFKRKKEDLEKISAVLIICEQTLFDFIEEISKTERNFGWPKHHEQELRKKINTALQQA